MASVIVPVGISDTAASLGARYTIGGAAYGPAIIAHNGAWGAAEGDIGADVPLSALGIVTAAIPSEWLRPGAQTISGAGAQVGLNTPVLGVPVWMLLGALAIVLAVR
jgi:hypothetical protein